MKHCIVLGLWTLALAGGTSSASAQATLITGLGGASGFGENELPANDDGSTTSIDISAEFPDGLNFFGTTYTQLFVNNNGNITFGGALGTFTPAAFPIAAQPMIAPYWGDVDTRGIATAPENLVYWDQSPGRLVVTWYEVGYFNSHVDLRMSFQLILTDPSGVGTGPGDFDVEFRYNRCEWTTGDASGGVGGLGGTPAQAGFDAGDLVNFLELPGSRTAAILDLCTTSNLGPDPVNRGIWRFFVRGGGVGECEDDSDCRDDLFCVDGFCCDTMCEGVCEACDVLGSEGECTVVSGAPHGDRSCGDGACAGTCDGVSTTMCSSFPAAGTACDDGLFCTDGDGCDGAGVCTAGEARDCDDGLVCTADSCDEDLDACVNDATDSCNIDGMCVANGTRNPDQPCEVCDSATSTSDWTLLTGGEDCDDGVFCSVGETCDASGACGGGTPNPCDDGLACTADSCDVGADACVNAAEGACLVDGVCVAEGTASPDSPCQVCDPASSTDGYSPADVGTECDDGSACTEGDACDAAGACAGTARDCDDGLACTSDTCDETSGDCQNDVADGCLVGGMCVASGGASSGDPCLVCDPARSTTDFSPSTSPECGGDTDAGMPPGDDAGVPTVPEFVTRGSGLCSAGPAGAASGGAPIGLALLGLVAVRRRRR